MATGVIEPSNNSTSDSILEIVQQNVTLRFALYGGLLFFIVQVALSRVAPGFEGYKWYSFEQPAVAEPRTGLNSGLNR